MKKMLGVFVLGIFLVFMMGFSSAGALESFGDGVESFYTALIQPILILIIGEPGINDIDGSFLAKVLFLIIIFSIVWKSLEKIPFFEDTAWVLWVVSVGVSVLAIRWFGDTEIVHAVLLPYSALGIALTAGIPFVLYFFIVKDFSRTMRKLSWTFFVVIFTALWSVRSGIFESGAPVGNVGAFAYIYLATAGLGFLVLMFDGTIQNMMGKAKMEKLRVGANRSLLDAQKRLIHTADKDYASGILSPADHETRIKAARKKIQGLQKTK